MGDGRLLISCECRFVQKAEGGISQQYRLQSVYQLDCPAVAGRQCCRAGRQEINRECVGAKCSGWQLKVYKYAACDISRSARWFGSETSELSANVADDVKAASGHEAGGGQMLYSCLRPQHSATKFFYSRSFDLFSSPVSSSPSNIHIYSLFFATHRPFDQYSTPLFFVPILLRPS
jgi:hypothetical protein